MTFSNISAYEDGDLGEDETVELFQDLIDSGLVWRLQGHYGRTASALIEDGRCTLGPVGHRDFYGNYVPAADEVVPGTKGSPEYAEEQS